MALAPQEINLDMFLTLEETLDLHGGYFGMTKADRRERTAELLEAFSLTSKRHERTRTLSGGMKRRLTLARALMHRPRLLILDEPTAGVDIELRLELWQYIEKINSEGTSIMLTTHYLEEAERLCDHIAFINHGEIAAQGTIPELSARYGVSSLEDAYLALVGRQELSRAHVEARARHERLADPAALADPARGQPLHEDQAPDARRPAARDLPLHLRVRGGAGHAHPPVHGYKYIVFVIPGLIMMAWALNAFSNNSSSILQQKFTHSIDDQLSSPASPMQLLLGFTLGGFIRGFLVSLLTYIVAAALLSLPVTHPLVLIPSLILVGLFFAQCGVLVGVRAEQFDDVALYQTFVLQPLIFLGGVFYGASLLPQPWQTLTQFNPVYYMIALVRYGFIGYHDTNIALAFVLPGAGHRGAVRAQLPHLRAGPLPAELTARQRPAASVPWPEVTRTISVNAAYEAWGASSFASAGRSWSSGSRPPS